MADITIREATKADVPSMSTIEVRCFHPVNAYHRKCFPDTPLLRQWWTDIFDAEVEDLTCHPLVAVDEACSDEAKRVVGVLLLRRFEAGEEGGGISTDFPMTVDHDRESCEPLFELGAKHRFDMMGDRRHFMVEYFGVDHECKGGGIGKQLIKRASEIADEERVDSFVEANGFARSFYAKAGFVLQEEIVMPGDEHYVECLMVRKRPAP